jgi:myo-inositol 2-dehydrogenase/D-chiro-inositol 1-dehydrogenase
MEKLKIGIIGAGYIGGVHAGILNRDERVRVVAIHDVDRQASERLATVCNAESSLSAEAVFETADAVFITTPNTKHTELALGGIASGTHIFCEKPMATLVDDARRIAEAAAASSRVFQVGHNRRFAPVYVMLKRLLSESTPHSAHVKMNRGELVNPGWVGDPSITGGFLYETTIHMFDMLRFQFGEVAELTAIGSTHEYPEVDDFSVLLKFRAGFHATMCSSADASWCFPFERIEVFGAHRTITTREMESLTDSDGLEVNHTTHSMHMFSRDEKWGYVQEDRAFVDAVLNGTAPPVSALDGLRSVELVDACYRSVASGKPVRFEAADAGI